MITLNVIIYFDVISVIYYARDEREQREEDIYNNMNVCIPVYINMGERGNAIKYI